MPRIMLLRCLRFQPRRRRIGAAAVRGAVGAVGLARRVAEAPAGRVYVAVDPLAAHVGRVVRSGGAEIAGDPQALADALSKIEAYAQGIALPAAEANPATGQMMIINPLSGGGLRGLFSTHPATEERVARLRALARGG